MGHILVYDLETKKTFDEVGGQGKPELLGISLAGVYNYTDNQYHAIREADLEQFGALLKECELLIGFNSKHFDNPVLQPYLPAIDINSIPHLDMLEEVVKELGFRVKLDNLAQSTLYEGKSGSGLDAIRYYRLGQWDRLTEYCLDDVRVTRDVYEYGKNHGYIWYLESGTPTKVSASWSNTETVSEIMDIADREHRQVEIEYIIPGQGAQGKTTRYTTVIDIRKKNNDEIIAFSYADQKEKTFLLPRIFTAKYTGDSSAFQPSLI